MNNLPNISRETAVKLLINLEAIADTFRDWFIKEKNDELQKVIDEANAELYPPAKMTKLPNPTKTAANLKELLDVPTNDSYVYDKPENIV